MSKKYFVAFQVKQVKVNNMVGLALGNSPPYEFDIKPNRNIQNSMNDRKTEMDGSSEID
jgi:hypothetical protein